MYSAVSFPYTSWSEWGRSAIAVSASKAKFCIQFFGLLCTVYLGPSVVGLIPTQRMPYLCCL